MKGMDRERGDSVRTFVEYEPGMRGKIAAAIDGLLAVLDQIDGDENLEDDELAEPDADEEPSLGATEAHFLDLSPGVQGIRLLSADQRRWAAGSGDDREAEHDGSEDGHDAEEDRSDFELSLAATLAVNQMDAWRLDDDGADLEDEHDGSEPSLGAPEPWNGDQTNWPSGNDRDLEEEHDGREPDVGAEPWLGATLEIDQERAGWNRPAGDDEADDADAEPSLGAPEVGFAGRGFDAAIGLCSMMEGRPIAVRIDPRDSGIDQSRWARGGSADLEQDRADFEPGDSGVADADGLAEQLGRR